MKLLLLFHYLLLYYDGFQHVNFIFSQNFISLFWGLFNDKTDLRVRYIFAWWKYLSFRNSSFALRYIFNVNGKATMWHTPLFLCFLGGGGRLKK
jgi:hypothetical protein